VALHQLIDRSRSVLLLGAKVRLTTVVSLLQARCELEVPQPVAYFDDGSKHPDAFDHVVAS
jgi:hypothetical protein